MTTKTLDRRVYELAAHFMFDHPKINTESNRLKLASIIQETIETEITIMLTEMDQLK